MNQHGVFGENHPRLKLSYSPKEKILELLSAVLLLAQFVYIAYVWKSLPETIPIHFGLSGEPDGWGPRGMLLILPAVGVVLSLGMSLVARVPHTHNYLIVKVTEENAERLYRQGRSILFVVKFLLVLIFGYIVYQSVQTAWGVAKGLSVWVIPTIIAAILIYTFGSLYAMYKRESAGR